MATERSLERLGADAFDVLLLHNPDRRGFESAEVWEGLRELRDEGLTRELGVAPGPANGFTLDVIGCFERYGELIDWAMLILGPLEPWPGELPLAAAQRNGVRVVTRVVDYGGLFHDDVLPGHEFARGDHRGFRPDGWVEAGREKLERLRPIAERHSLTPLQLACAWNLAHPAVECVAPTLIEEPGGAKPIERKREELAGVPPTSPLSAEEVEAIRAIGDNSGSMLLKGATPDHEGEDAPDRWTLGESQLEVAERWGIDPERQLRKASPRLQPIFTGVAGREPPAAAAAGPRSAAAARCPRGAPCRGTRRTGGTGRRRSTRPPRPPRGRAPPRCPRRRRARRARRRASRSASTAAANGTAPRSPGRR